MSAKKRTPPKPPPPPAERKQSPGARPAGTEKSPGRAALAGTTTRERAEKALRMSEARFRSIFEHAGTGIAINGLGGRFVQCNPAYCRITGYSEVELCAMKFPTLIHPEDRAENLKIAMRLLNNEIPSFGIENRYLRKNGEAVWVHKFVSLLRDEQGRGTHIVALVTDITERRRAEEALESRSRQQQAIAKLSQHAVAGRDLHRLIQDAVALVPQVLGVGFCKLLELRQAAGDLLVRAGTGWKKNCVGRATVSVGCGSQAGFTLIENRPILVEDYALETRFPMSAMLARHGIRSGVSVVIHTHGAAFGVLAAHSREPRRFSGDDAHFVQSVANVLAAAIDRRDLEEELLKSGDNERARIGQDLHDDLCQQLTGIALRTEVLRLRLADLPEAQAEVEKIGGFLRVATLHARTLAHGLSPVQLEASGLMAALHELAADMGDLFRVACVFRCESQVLIADPFAATHLYRIAQEAISNAVRHGRAKNIVVSLAPGPAGGVLTVVDDGSGCATPMWESAGMGLRTMQYRSEMIGASLRVEPAEGGGTAVRCEFQITTKRRPVKLRRK